MKLKMCLFLVIISSFSLAYANDVFPPFANDICFVFGIREPNSYIFDGMTKCDQVKLPYIKVRGPLTLINTTISGKADIYGSLRAISSTLQNILIEKQIKPVTVVIKDHSIVNGNIKFIGQEGFVCLDHTSRIYGQIIHGRLTPANRLC